MYSNYWCFHFQIIALVTMEEHSYLMCVNALALQAGQDQDVQPVSTIIMPPARDIPAHMRCIVVSVYML